MTTMQSAGYLALTLGCAAITIYSAATLVRPDTAPEPGCAYTKIVKVDGRDVRAKCTRIDGMEICTMRTMEEAESL